MLSIFVWFILISYYRVSSYEYPIAYDVTYTNQSNTQIFYSDNPNEFSEGNSELFSIGETVATRVKCNVNDGYRYLRIDLGDKDNNIKISDIGIRYRIKKNILTPGLIVGENGICDMTYSEETYIIRVTGNDPYIIFDLENPLAEIENMVYNLNQILALVYLVLAMFLCVLVYRSYNEIVADIKWLLAILRDWERIGGLAVNDFKMRYAASYLGVFWAFVQPVVTVSIYSIIFGMGFKSLPVEGVSFPIWLTVGIIPWFFFSEALITGTNSLLEYSYLVKKVVFNVNVLPVVKIVSATFIHIFFILVAIIMLLATKKPITIYMIQILYYLSCTMFLVLGLSYMTAATVAFFKDLGQIVSIILQFGMWATPIMYPASMLGPTVEKILKFNPMFYIVDGYRDAFFQNIWFWEKPKMGFYFWTVSIVILFAGIRVFKGLEKHFADVL